MQCVQRGGEARGGSGQGKAINTSWCQAGREQESGQQGQVVQVAVGNMEVHAPAGTGSCPCAGPTEKDAACEAAMPPAPREVAQAQL